NREQSVDASGPGAPTGPEADDAAVQALRKELAEADEDGRAALLLELVRTEAARVLGVAGPARIRPRRGFVDMGFDSLMAVELRNGVGARTGLRLPTTLVFDFPTARDLAGHLVERFATELPAPADGPVARAAAELEKLDGLLATLPAGDAEAAGITRRLEALLAGWQAAHPAAPGSGLPPHADPAATGPASLPAAPPSPGQAPPPAATDHADAVTDTATGATDDDLLSDATPDELFELIQREFGKS
ncbi:acyl carrier protein, partial [Streptomyces marinisediminis]|uniref:acyl carrier protein n=1 Tax=Streptomyces marinisediminis TaxID=2984864 RepID=UPI002248FE1B